MLTKIITLIVLTRAVRGNILESQLSYQKPKLERNNIINKGIWVRNKLQENLFDKTRIGNFIFRENSLDVENLLQNNFDPFVDNYMEDAPTVSNYIKRAKRAIRRIREQRLRKSLQNCIGKGCKTFIIEKQEEVGKEPMNLDDKDELTSVFNDYPYEVAILLNNNKREIKTPQNDTITLENDISKNSNNLSKINDITEKPKLSVETDFKEKNDTIATNITSPKRSKKYDFESEIIKKIEFDEDMNKTQKNNEHSESKVTDRNIFDKDTTVWHQNAPIPDVNVYKVVPKEPQKSKAVTERGLIKVISMLTKTFKKIMKQHNEIKDIHEQITDVNDQFVKNAGAIRTKFQDFDVKYLYLLKFYEKLKIFDAKLANKQEYFKNKEREMASNFKEFENQQKKFLQQQRHFYNIQKLMLAQNEKINAKQNVIAKTQSEISHRQNNFARILKKAKQLYLESRNPTTKLSSNVIKPFHNPKPAVPKSQISTTTPSIESVKINLFSIPTSNKIENQDDMIIKEKDDQTIDDLVYKYYFNNTFIDNVMKNNVLTSLMGISHSTGVPRNVKNKRNELETTILLPIYENNDSEGIVSKNRERRWINHHSRHKSKRRERGKGGVATIMNATDAKANRNKVVNYIPVVEEIPKVKDEGDIKTQNDPFLSMATNFCNEIRQNANSQMLRWCVEKALRRLQFLDINNVPTLANEAPTTTASKPTLSSKPRKAHKHKEQTKLKTKENTILQPLITKLITKAAIELNTVKAVPTTASTTTVLVTEIRDTASSSTEASSPTTLAATKLAPVPPTENATNLLDANIFFPDNEELESNLKQYDIKPDLEGNVYFEGSIHASDILDSDINSQGMDDIMPGLESNSRFEMDPLAFDLQAQRRAIVRKCPLGAVIICYVTILAWTSSSTSLHHVISENKKVTSHMTRCDYDAVFYRVFCVTLLALAFTFTVILTNVFVDIDGLLASKKEKLNDNIIHNEFTTEASDKDEMNYGESDNSYRTKRSIETQSFLFHIKNPKVKTILANRLSTLLEELEAEETADITPTEKKTVEDIPKVVEKSKLAEDVKKDKMLHLSMHNILLEGIERHVDLNEVYSRMYSLMTNFNKFQDKKDGPQLKPNDNGKEGDDPKLQKPIELKFFNEMLNCNELQDQIVQTTAKPAKAPPNVMIKTVIDITSIGNDKLIENDTKTAIDNIQGDIELVYNGKVIKFTHSDAKMAQPTPQKKLPDAFKTKRATIETTTKETNDYNMIPKSYMNKLVEEYFKHFPHGSKDKNNEINRHFQTKRLKRHVRIKYENDDPGKVKKSIKKNTEEDELFVEIETHFDSKGMKGEKKKKLIKNLIDKIQKAIHSDVTSNLATTGKNSTKQRKSIHFRKRLQNPLKHSINHVLLNKYSLPITNFVHRQLHPISKTVTMQEQISPFIGTQSGEDWKKTNIGPGFLADTKAINSAEMSEVNVDYSKILEVNGIPQRLQQPLNTELSEETIKTNSYYDMGKRKFVIKDIDGSGFSVGFNQYVDEPPDKESMRLFSGLENVIKSYHQTYDPAPVSTKETDLNFEERLMEPPSNEHTIARRSINNKHDYHSNEYKIIFNNDFLKYKDYRDIYKTKKKKPKVNPSKDRESPLIVDENIFEKNLNPSEIFSLANLFQRKKRAINVKKVNDLSTRLKFNRFLNTNAMSKTIFLNTKRNKRQINKIRIIATDLPHMSKQSDENVFVVSDENIFADRALVKEVETADDHEKQEEYPYQNNESETYITKIFDGRSRHNPLMSKYPHIFMEEVSRSREEYIPNNALLFGKLPGLRKTNTDIVENNDDNIDIEQFLASSNDTKQQKQLKDQEIVNALTGSPANKANYKVTVKVMPKNQTAGLNSGFKEIHTSINKSFNKNGLLYSSLVNVSEISKVIKLNRTIYEGVKDGKVYKRKEETSLTRKIQDQQEKMQFLLKQHAQHINEQLSRLNEEKMNLESMLYGENTDNNGDIDSNALSASIRRLKLDSKEIVGTTVGVTPIEVQTTTVNIKPCEELPPSTTPPAPPTQLQGFSEKVKNNNIISTIERNGNLTDQILQKIDRNTEILQMFLKKLSERIEVVPTASLKPERLTQDNNTAPTEWRNQVMPFTQNMVIRKNDSHISIPFTYAYQPPTSPSLKNKTQVASVVYQGHIRNAVRHRDILHAGENQVQKITEANNQSRFFIDELENEYKVIEVGPKKNRDYNMVSKNDTL